MPEEHGRCMLREERMEKPETHYDSNASTSQSSGSGIDCRCGRHVLVSIWAELYLSSDIIQSRLSGISCSLLTPDALSCILVQRAQQLRKPQKRQKPPRCQQRLNPPRQSHQNILTVRLRAKSCLSYPRVYHIRFELLQ